MRHYDEDDTEGVDSVFKEHVGVDTRRGVFRFFGKEFEVNRSIAPWLKTLENLVMSWVYDRGGTLSRQWATQSAKTFSFSDPRAAQIGSSAELLFRFGGPLVQTAANITSTMRSSYKGMNALRDEASILLAANNNMNTSVSNLLTCKYSALCHKRAIVYTNAKRGVIGSFINAVSQAPLLMRGYYRYHLDRIRNPKLAAPVDQEYYKKLQSAQPVSQESSADTGIINTVKDKLEKNLPDELRHDPLVNTLKEASWILDAKARGSLLRPRSEYDFEQNLSNSAILVPGAGLLAGWLSERFADKHRDQIVAWDRIKELESYLHRHKHPDHNRVASMVKDVFEQHVKDLGKEYELQGADFDSAMGAICSAITYGKLNPQALAEMLDDQKIVTFGSKEADFGELDDIKKQLAALQEKYGGKANEKEFFKSTPFTKEILVRTFREMPKEERPFFALLFKPELLEKAGLTKEEIRENQDKGKQYFADELTQMTKFLIEMGREELKKRGVKGKIVDELEAFDEGLRRADLSDNGNSFIEQNKEAVSDVIRNTIGSLKKSNELWEAFIARKRGQREDEIDHSHTPIKPKDMMQHAERHSGEASHQFG